MGANILVTTPQPAFGELLRLSLEEAGHYTVRLAQNGREAQFAASRLAFEVAILDSSLPEQAIQALVEVLRSANHGLRLVMIAPPPDSPQPSLNGLHPDATLSQPFYMPDLLEIIAGLVRRPVLGALSANGKPAGIVSDLPARPPEPALRPAGELSELLAQAAAPANPLAAIIIRNRAIYASSGRLDEPNLRELAEAFNRTWKDESPTDLVRYLRPASRKEVLLYATSLGPGLALVLACESTTLITRVRQQAVKIAQVLRPQLAATPAPIAAVQPAPAANPEMRAEDAAAAPAPVPAAEPADLLQGPAPASAETEDLLRALRLAGAEAGTEPAAAEEAPLEVSLSDLLAAMPSPDPGARARANAQDWVPSAESEPGSAGTFLFPWELEERAENAAPTQNPAPEIPSPEEVSASLEVTTRMSSATRPTQTEIESSTEVTRRIERSPIISTTLVTPGPPPPAAAQAIQSISETRPNPNTVQPVSQDMEPQPPEFASLAYTCVLVPRLPHHRLLGPLAECLSDWLPQICLAYGWRLAWQAIQPDCFEWAVVVTPVISPGIVVRLIRQLTSQRIFERYAGLAQENPSGDFWAPGYLIISGAQPPDASLISNYLQQTRRRQGLL